MLQNNDSRNNCNTLEQKENLCNVVRYKWTLIRFQLIQADNFIHKCICKKT